MENLRKIKVVWVCHFSNPIVRQRLKFNRWTPLAIIRALKGRGIQSDFAVWNTNAIREFEQFNDIELHIIAPHFGIKGLQQFIINGISYNFFQPEGDNLISKLFYHKPIKGFNKNSKIILKLIDILKPDLVHYIGAENPYYSESALYVNKGIPLLVSLQTLLSDPKFYDNYCISKTSYEYRAAIEISVIKRADYVATKSQYFRSIIRSQIGNVKFLDMTLALGENVSIGRCYNKQFDFVYFSADISKAVDYAIEAFAIAKIKHPNISLHIVGGFSESRMQSIQQQMNRLKLCDGIDFTGKLPTHDDVIAEIQKARFALLPLKIDLISGTIREAMANGLPVVTTITPSTPSLNDGYECVLLSEKGDFEAMASNMCRLIEDKSLAEKLSDNGIQRVQEKYDNKSAMLEWIENYRNILKVNTI